MALEWTWKAPPQALTGSFLCPCVSRAGQRRAEDDSCTGQSAKRRPASQLITERDNRHLSQCGQARAASQQEQHAPLAHPGQTQSPRDSEQSMYSLLLKESRATLCWCLRAWKSCGKLSPRGGHSPEEGAMIRALKMASGPQTSPSVQLCRQLCIPGRQ